MKPPSCLPTFLAHLPEMRRRVDKLREKWGPVAMLAEMELPALSLLVPAQGGDPQTRTYPVWYGRLNFSDASLVTFLDTLPAGAIMAVFPVKP